MTAARYAAYRRLQAQIDRDPRLDGEERDLMRQFGEDLLLARAGEEDAAAERRHDTALALSLLVSVGRFRESDADHIWQSVAACGPPLDVRIERPVAAA